MENLQLIFFVLEFVFKNELMLGLIVFLLHREQGKNIKFKSQPSLWVLLKTGFNPFAFSRFAFGHQNGVSTDNRNC